MLSVLKIITHASKLLGDKEMIENIKNKNYDNENIDVLMTAVNMLNNQIAANYIDIVESVKVSASRGVIPYYEISTKNILQIKSVTTIDGIDVPFETRSNSICLPNGDYEIKYSYFPNDVLINDVIDYYTNISERIFAQGVVGEYLFLKGDIEEASAWDKRFKQNLFCALRPRRGITMPKRRWV